MFGPAVENEPAFLKDRPKEGEEGEEGKSRDF